MYWNLNSGTKTYNQLVTKDPGGDREHLIEYDNYRIKNGTRWDTVGRRHRLSEARAMKNTALPTGRR